MPAYNDWAAQDKRTKGYTSNMDLENTTSFAKRSKKARPGIPQSPFVSNQRAVPSSLNQQQAEQVPTPQETEQIPTFADFLAQAQQLVGGQQGGGVDYGGLRADYQDQATRGDAALAAMYSQLRGSIDADAPTIQKGYDQASAEIGNNGAAAIKTTNDAANAARQAQTQQFQALGIGDAAGVLASQGGFAASDQAAAVGNIAQDQAAGQNQAVANKASALNYNTGVGNAAGLEGTVQRANLQEQLAQKLAELGIAEQQDNAQQGDDRASQVQLAMQLFGMDQQGRSGAAEAEADAQQQDFENQLAMQRLMLDQTKAQGSQQTLQDSLGTVDSIIPVAKGLGMDPLDFMKLLQGASRVG